MSTHTKEIILVWENGFIALSYLVMSFLFATVFILTYMRIKHDEIGKWTVRLMVVGSALFLMGCGLHHEHLAMTMIPESVDNFREDSLWIDHFYNHFIISTAQVIGAPMVLIAGGRILLATFRQR